MVRKVAIYTRVSTLDQTIDNQLIELRDHCSKMGWEITKEYADEGLSGTLSREKRPALNSLIKDAYQKRFDLVVCWDISRIGRSMKELVLFLSDMKDKGVGICSVRQGFDNRNQEWDFDVLLVFLSFPIPKPDAPVEVLTQLYGSISLRME